MPAPAKPVPAMPAPAKRATAKTAPAETATAETREILPAHSALLLELRPPIKCFDPWEVNVAQAVPYVDTTSGTRQISSARTAAIVLQVLADGLEQLHAVIGPNAPMPMPMPLLGPLAGTTLVASPMCLVDQSCSIRYGELVLVCRPVEDVIRELRELMGKGSVAFGELKHIKEGDIIKLASDVSVVKWTNTQGEFCRMWEEIKKQQLAIKTEEDKRQLAIQTEEDKRQLAIQTEDDKRQLEIQTEKEKLEQAIKNVELEIKVARLEKTEQIEPLKERLAVLEKSREGVSPLSTPPAFAELLSGNPAAAGRDEASAAAGLQRACDIIGRVLVCAGASTRSSGVFMVMHDVTEHSAVTMEHVEEWSTFFKQIVEDFLLPLAEKNIVYFDLRPGCRNLRVTSAPPVQYLPLDLDSLTVFNSERLKRNSINGRYPHHHACTDSLDFVYTQTLLVAFCASVALSPGAPAGGLRSCEDLFYHSAALVPWDVAEPTTSVPSLQTLFNVWLTNQQRPQKFPRVPKINPPTENKHLTPNDILQLRYLSITSDVNVGLLQ